jgi:2-oxoglutarate ferredoxin oxidoreductase subunit alpha
MERLLRKFDTAKSLVPQPIVRSAQQKTRYGAIYYGSTSPSMDEAIEALENDGMHLDTLRVRAFPFPDSVAEFIAAHDKVFIVEQNRDGQLRSLVINEFGIDPAKLIALLHYEGAPITARFIGGEISKMLHQWKVVSIESGRVAHS